MWTRGPDKEEPGKFYFELWDGNTLVKRVGGFETHTEADRAAEQAQRQHLFPTSQMTVEEVLADLDEIEKLLNL